MERKITFMVLVHVGKEILKSTEPDGTSQNQTEPVRTCTGSWQLHQNQFFWTEPTGSEERETAAMLMTSLTGRKSTADFRGEIS